MPYWFEFNQMRSFKDLEMFDEFGAFKRRVIGFIYVKRYFGMDNVNEISFLGQVGN